MKQKKGKGKIPCAKCGLKKSIKARGLCTTCYRATLRAEKAAKGAPGPAPKKTIREKVKQTKEQIVDAILGGKVKQTPPDVKKSLTGPKGPVSGGKGTAAIPPGPGPAAAMVIPPSFFKMIGNFLYNMTEQTEEFKLDDEGAQYMADMLRAALMSKGVEADPMVMFIVAMVLWLGLGFAAYAWKKYGDSEEDDTDKKERKTLWERMFPKEKEQTAPLQAPSPQEAPAPPKPAIPVYHPMPTMKVQRQANPDWKPMDLTKAMKRANKEKRTTVG